MFRFSVQLMAAKSFRNSGLDKYTQVLGIVNNITRTGSTIVIIKI